MGRLVKICRILLGLTFVFSGFVKTIDPWGTALKITEYLNVWGIGGVLGDGDGLRIALSIAMCAAELALGLMLVFGMWKRLTALVALAVMSVFVVVTLLSATVLPVEECGCFGDAIHLSPWGSFAKNVVLLGLAIIVCREKYPSAVLSSLKQWLAVVLFACLSVGLGVWCYLHLPLVDFLPYKVGVNLREARFGDPQGLEEGSREGDIRLREFTIFNSEGDGTWDLLEDKGRTNILVANKLSDITPRVAQKLEKIEGRKILVTSSPIPDGSDPNIYNIDSGTSITMLRARTGVVVIEDGIIIDKKQIR